MRRANRYLLLRDDENRLFQFMGYVGEDIDNLLTNNVFAMTNAKMQIQLETLSRQHTKEELERNEWKNDQALYDKLLMQYTKITNKFLTRWC